MGRVNRLLERRVLRRAADQALLTALTQRPDVRRRASRAAHRIKTSNTAVPRPMPANRMTASR